MQVEDQARRVTIGLGLLTIAHVQAVTGDARAGGGARQRAGGEAASQGGYDDSGCESAGEEDGKNC